MSREHWAAIVYGRSYHLDFRLIAMPEDFNQSHTAWALEHILATTRQARNLADLPRWSLFKNNSHCVVGVTCMVRDLIGSSSATDSGEVMTKDDLGRPLYIFVGYVTQLGKKKSLLDFPAYTGQDLVAFKPLYQQIENVWLVKDYEENSRHPILSNYQALTLAMESIAMETNVNHSIKLNNQHKSPDKIFMWSNSQHQNHQLWNSAAKCSIATSLCLDIKGKSLVNSPFLNQSLTQVEEFTIGDRLTSNRQASQPQFPKKVKPNQFPQPQSLPQKISQKAKADINITLSQASKVAMASQELIERLGDRSDSSSLKLNLNSQSEVDDNDSFGFKSKNTKPQPKNQDWF